MARKKCKGTELKVFKGRESKLNQAIFEILCLKGALTIYEVYKETINRKGLLRTRYSSINKRIKALEKTGYVKKVATRLTKAGFKANVFDVTANAYVAIFLSKRNISGIVQNASEEFSLAIISDFLLLSSEF
jgi:hypothetical protein